MLGQSLGLGARRNRVDLCSVDEVDPGIHGHVELRMGLGLAVLLAEGHGPEAQSADFEPRVAKLSVVHRDPLRVLW